MKVKEILACLEEKFPLAYQENYDNAGLILGDREADVTGVLICLDVSEAVVDEAVVLGANVIVSHHPLIFNGIKKLNPIAYPDRILIQAIKNQLNLYACHTNFDNVKYGINARMAEKLGLAGAQILSPLSGRLYKLVTFVPHQYAARVRQAMFEAGAGNIGAYDHCSYNVEGYGTFRGSDSANPFVGEKGIEHTEPETRVEVIFPDYLQNKILRHLLEAHPYEEVAYDIIPLANSSPIAGAGLIGNLPEPLDYDAFLAMVKKTLGVQSLRYSAPIKNYVHKIAVCGGSGSFLIPACLAAGVDAFITADIKYHQFIEATGRLLLVDAGHYETEVGAKEIFYELLTKKFPNFAIHFSKRDFNPINYL